MYGVPEASAISVSVIIATIKSRVSDVFLWILQFSFEDLLIAFYWCMVSREGNGKLFMGKLVNDNYAICIN